MKRLEKIPTIDVKKYGGKQVAIVDGEIIAVGNTLKEVIEKARQREPSHSLHEIKIFAVPRTLSAIFYVSPIFVRHRAARRR